MRILQVSCACDPFHSGGVAQLVRRIGSRLASQGHRVCVFTVVHDRRRPAGEVFRKKVNGFHVVALNEPVDGDFLARYCVEDYLNPKVHEPFRRLVQEFAPDAIHFHAIQGMGAGMLNWVPPGVPTVLTMHDYWWVCPNLFLTRLDESLCSLRRPDLSACEDCLRPLASINPESSFGLDKLDHRARFLSRQLKRFTRILTVSGQIRDRLAGFLPDLDIEVCENGIEWEERASKATQNGRPGRVQSERLRFGFLGGMNRLKGYECLMHAVRRVNNPNFQVVVYGCATAWRSRIGQAFPGLRRVYRSMRGRNGQDAEPAAYSRVSLRPHFPADHRERIFGALDVLLVPSMVRESFSLVCREALVAGVPVIASRCGGPEEIIRHEENGLLFEPGDADGLAACMARCLEEPDLLESLRRSANAKGIRSLSDQVEQILDTYQAGMKRKRQEGRSEVSSLAPEQRPALLAAECPVAHEATTGGRHTAEKEPESEMATLTQTDAEATSDTLPPFVPDPQDEGRAESLLRQYLPKIVSGTHVENHLRELMSLEGGFVDRLNYISPRVPDQAKAALLISGCAAGSEMMVARKFGYQRICGTEVVQELVAICKQRLRAAPGFEIVHYDGLKLPHPDNTFSMIMSGHIIEHTSSPYNYLREHMRVLQPGGWLFLEFPNRYHLTELHTGLPSVEYLPRPMRALALRYFASPLSPFAEQNRAKYRTVRLKLKPVSIWQVRMYLRRMEMGDARIVHHYKPAAGYVRMLIEK